jgi:hypothetical protein
LAIWYTSFASSSGHFLPALGFWWGSRQFLLLDKKKKGVLRTPHKKRGSDGKSERKKINWNSKGELKTTRMPLQLT